MDLRRDSPSTTSGSRGVAVGPKDRPRVTVMPVAAGGGGVSMLPGGTGSPPGYRRQDYVRHPVQEGLGVTSPGRAPPGGGAPAAPLADPATAPASGGAAPAGGTHGEAGVEKVSAIEAMDDRPLAGEQAVGLLPGQLDMPGPAEVEATRIRADNKPAAGYDAGTAARGGGTGGTTEAMTGGLASGGAIGDERRAGMGDLARGSMY